MKEMQTTIEPGFYQMHLGGASLRECWRLSRNPIQLLIFLCWKALDKKLDSFIWLPVHEASRDCTFDELGNRTKEHLKPRIQEAAALGFANGNCLVVEKVYNEGITEGGGYFALDKDKKRFMSLAFAYNRIDAPGLSQSVVSEQLCCLVGFCNAVSRYTTMVHNDKNHFDPCGNTNLIYLKTRDISKLARRAEEELQKYAYPVKSFHDIAEYDDFIRPVHDELWLHRINRGLCVRVPQI